MLYVYVELEKISNFFFSCNIPCRKLAFLQ